MQNARLDESQAGIKNDRRNINNLRYADNTTLIAERVEELKSLYKESEKAGLKLNIQKTKIMASSLITSWQIEGENWKQWQILFSWAPRAGGDYSHEIKTCSLEGKLWQN